MWPLGERFHSFVSPCLTFFKPATAPLRGFCVCLCTSDCDLQDDFPLASLPLLGYTVSTPEESDSIHKDYVFKLQFKSHVYFFRAESEYTFERWGSRRTPHPPLRSVSILKTRWTVFAGGWRWSRAPPAARAGWACLSPKDAPLRWTGTDEGLGPRRKDCLLCYMSATCCRDWRTIPAESVKASHSLLLPLSFFLSPH